MTELSVQTSTDPVAHEVTSRTALVARRFFRKPLALTGLAVLTVIFLLAYLSPLVSP